MRTLPDYLKENSVYQNIPKWVQWDSQYADTACLLKGEECLPENTKTITVQWDSYCGDIYLPTWKGRMSTVTHQNKYSETPNVRTLLACLKGKSVYQKTPKQLQWDSYCGDIYLPTWKGRMSTVTHQNKYSETPNVRTLLACLKGKSVYQKTPKQLQWYSYCGDIYLPTWKGRMSTVTHQNKYSETPNVRHCLPV